ncbi:MAG: hypothetical protein KDK72_10695, partial [Chlamydiia bacterium]|nr:hypothetical protein [Chlamydiia bacterium]
MAPKIENFPPPVFFTQAPIPSDNQPSEREQKVADFASSRSCSTPEMTKKPPTLKTYSPRASLGLNPVPRNHFDIAKVKDKCQGAISHEPITDLLERYLFDVNFRLEVMRKIREGGLQQIKEECTCQQKLMPIISRVEKVKHALGQQYKQFSDVLDMVASHAQNRAIFLTFYEKMYVFPEMSHYHTAKFVDSLILGSSKRKDLVAFLKNINSKVKTIVIEEARRCCVEKLTDGPIYQVNKIKCLANSKGIIDTIVRGNNLCFQELFINGEQVDFSHCSEGRYSHQVMGVILHHLYGKETAEVKLPLVMEEKDIP